MSDALLLIGLTVFGGVAYCALHHYSEAERARRLSAREAWTIEQFVAALRSARPPRDELAGLFLEALGKALCVPSSKLRPSDRFDVDYRLKYDVILLDEFDESLFAYVNSSLQARGIPGWRPARRLSTVEDAIAALEEHVGWIRRREDKHNSSGTQECQKSRAGTNYNASKRR